MRLFVALDIDQAIRERLADFVEAVGHLSPNARWIGAESLHVTLKFIGEKSADSLAAISHALGTIEVDSLDITFRGYGFFPAARALRVFWIGVEENPKLTSLAHKIDKSLSALRILEEEHDYHPHLTLARLKGRSGSARRQHSDSPNQSFQALQKHVEKLPRPEFGTMMARNFFLYQSETSFGGSKYSKLAAFPLH